MLTELHLRRVAEETGEDARGSGPSASGWEEAVEEAAEVGEQAEKTAEHAAEVEEQAEEASENAAEWTAEDDEGWGSDDVVHSPAFWGNAEESEAGS